MMQCDLCDKDSLQEYVDGKTAMGPWANMCLDCFKIFGKGLGLGKGQHYRLGADKIYRKIAG